MISLRELFYGLYGAYRLCRFDPQGMAFFDASERGFWLSFYSAVLVAPIHAAIVTINLKPLHLEASLVNVIAIEALTYVILVFAYPLVMHAICRRIGRQQRYFAYIVAYNWTGVLLSALALPAVALDLGLVPTDIVNLVQLVTTVITMVITWYIARTALQVTRAGAAGLVVLDFVLGILISSIAESRLMVS